MNRRRLAPRPTSVRSERSRRRLLLLEPDSLTRWSVERYLRPWFDVVSTTDAMEGDRMMDERGFDAVVISDSVPIALVERLEAHARELNPTVRLVRTVSDDAEESGQTRLEKPFDLSTLARLLGVDS